MRTLGFDPMPWQEWALDVAYEHEGGALVYREVVWEVPRQAGKTASGLSVITHRGTVLARRFGRPQRSIYSAQTRNDAREKFVDEWLPLLEGSPEQRTKFYPLFRKRLALGSEAILWGNGSVHSIVAPTEKAGHGKTLDAAYIDEAFALVDDRLEQAAKPAMLTRTNAQLWVVSAAGTDASAYLKKKIEIGRQRAQLGLTEGACYAEWSADPDEDDLTSPEVWARTHPAIGYTITRETVAADFASMDRAEFERAMLCVWPGRKHDAVIPADWWARQRDERAKIVKPVAFALAVDPDRSTATIAAAWQSRKGLVFDITTDERNRLDNRSGTSWVASRAKALQDKYGGSLAIDSGGPSGSLLPALQAAGVNVRAFNMRDLVRATGLVFDGLKDGTVWHGGRPPLDVAAEGALKRKLGESWTWARVPGLDITPLEACTLAAWSACNPEQEQEQALDWLVPPWER